MKNEVYDFLKRVALVILPALATLVITIFQYGIYHMESKEVPL